MPVAAKVWLCASAAFFFLLEQQRLRPSCTTSDTWLCGVQHVYLILADQTSQNLHAFPALLLSRGAIVRLVDPAYLFLPSVHLDVGMLDLLVTFFDHWP